MMSFNYYFTIKLISKLLSFPTPVNSNLFCNIGSVIVVTMFIEFLTGVLLSFKISGFNSGVKVKLEVLNNSFLGWFILKLHIFTPNLIAILIILHIFKCLINPVNSSKEVIISGLFLIIFFISVSYTGYSLSKGSMGYWAVVVVNSLLKEGLGVKISSSLFFDTSLGLGEETFLKIFTYHFLLSIVVIILQILHIFFLHKTGSSNFVSSLYLDYLRFKVIMFVKDLFLIFISLFLFLFSLFYGNFKIYGENFLEVNEFKALELSVEWYVRMFFIILRSVSFKLFGILFTLVFLLLILLSFFIKDLFRLDSFKSNNSYILFFIVNTYLIYLSYFGFSSYLFSVSILLIIILYYSLDIFFIKFSYNVIKY